MESRTTQVQALYDAFGRGDLAAILAVCDADIIWGSNADAERIPWGGVRHRHEGATAFFVELSTHLEFEAFEPGEMFPSGETVVVLGHSRARCKTGRKGTFSSDWVHVFTWREGRLVRFHEHYDTAAIERAL